MQECHPILPAFPFGLTGPGASVKISVPMAPPGGGESVSLPEKG